jgi:hypothetical protein
MAIDFLNSTDYWIILPPIKKNLHLKENFFIAKRFLLENVRKKILGKNQVQ